MVIFRSTLGINVTQPTMPTVPVGSNVVFVGSTVGLTSECAAIITSTGDLAVTRPRDMQYERKRTVVDVEYFKLVDELALTIKPYLFNDCVSPTDR